jgi:hypothetical protein
MPVRLSQIVLAKKFAEAGKKKSVINMI